MKRSLHVIIIDDDREREDVYRLFIDAFNKVRDPEFVYELIPHYCFSANSAIQTVYSTRGLAIILLDMVRPWEKERDSLRTAIVRSQIPVFALSEHFNSADATVEYMFYARERPGYPPPIIHFRDIRTAASGHLWRTIFDVFLANLAVLFGLDGSFSLTDDDEVNIIHMTDVHMDSFGLTGEDLQDIGTVLSTRRGAGSLNADFIAVTGDVTNRGRLATYAKAIEKFKGMLVHGWMRDGVSTTIPSNRILISPGNHDYCEQLGGSNVLSHAGGSSLTGFKINESLVPGADGFWRYGLIPFLDFHRRISGISVASVTDFLGFRTNFSYIAHGIAFVEVWAQQFRCGSNSDAAEKAWLSQAIEKVRTEIEKNTIASDTIVFLLHHLSTENPDEFDSQIIRAFARVSHDRVVIVLSGHLHTSNVQHISFDGGGRSRALHVRTDTMNHSQVRPGVLASFSVISLVRKNGVVIGARITKVEFKGSYGWVVEENRAKVFDLVTDGWRLCD